MSGKGLAVVATGRMAVVAMLALVAQAGSVRAESVAEPDVSEALCQVLVTFQQNDAGRPWQSGQTGMRAGYGIRVGPGRVLTTETLVRNHRLVELRRPRSGAKLRAEVAIADDQVNLALLRIVSDEAPPPPHVPIREERLGRDGAVTILQLDETQAVQSGPARVLQIDVDGLPGTAHSALLFSLLADLTVRGEGAPVIAGGRLAGLILRFDAKSREAGMLPYPLIAQFLKGAAANPYPGFASAGFVWQSLVDPTHRRYLGLDPNGKGVLVLSCIPGAGAAEVLRPNDVILEWNGHAIDNLGYYEDPEFGRLLLPHLIKGRALPGDRAAVTLMREGREMGVQVPLARIADGDALIPEDLSGPPADYLVMGGLVLRELTGEYLRAHGSKWKRLVDPRLVHLYLTQRRSTGLPGEHIVLLSHVLRHPINVGYERYGNAIVESVNGETINNLRDVFRIVDRDGAIGTIRLRGHGVDLALDRDALAEADRQIARLYGIPRLRRDSGAGGALPAAADAR